MCKKYFYGKRIVIRGNDETKKNMLMKYVLCDINVIVVMDSGAYMVAHALSLGVMLNIITHHPLLPLHVTHGVFFFTLSIMVVIEPKKVCVRA